MTLSLGFGVCRLVDTQPIMISFSSTLATYGVRRLSSRNPEILRPNLGKDDVFYLLRLRPTQHCVGVPVVYLSTARSRSVNMSSCNEPVADDAANEAERLNVLDGRLRELANKTQTQERASMENRRRLEELTREAKEHAKHVGGMLANRSVTKTLEVGKESACEDTSDEHLPEDSSGGKDEETADYSS